MSDWPSLPSLVRLPLTGGAAAVLALLGCLFGLAGLATAGQQASAGSDRKAQVELVVPRTTVRPGETVPIGVKFTMQPGWHIYWKNPGDAGQAPTFRWNLPGGGAARMLRGGPWKASEPQFPTPVRWTDAGGIVGFGYSESVVFPATLTIPSSVTPGQAAEVSVVVDYLICKDVCIPESATATAQFEVGMEMGGEEDQDAVEAIEQAKSAVPTDGGDRVKVQRGESQGDQQQYTVEVQLPQGAKDVAFFPNPPSALAVEDVEVETEGSTATITFHTRRFGGQQVEAKEFEAVIGYTTDEGRRGLSAKIPIVEASAQ